MESTDKIRIALEKRKQKITSFELYMHAFVSLVSLEGRGCEIVHDGNQCKLIDREDAGWDPVTYFELYRYLLTSILLKIDQTSRLATFLKRQIGVVEDLLIFENSPVTSHIHLIKQIMKHRGSYVLYPWGTIDHQIYCELWHKGNGQFVDTVYDCGVGHNGETIRDNYHPLISVATKDEIEFFDAINRLVTTQNQTPTLALYCSTLGFDPTVSSDCLPEKSHPSSNCVVKNLLAAVQQDAIDLYGEAGHNLFKQFYLALVKETLLCASQYTIPFFNAPLPQLRNLCSFISQKQQSFTGASNHEVMSEVEKLYESIKQATTKHVARLIPRSAILAAPQPAKPFYGDNANTQAKSIRRFSMNY